MPCSCFQVRYLSASGGALLTSPRCTPALDALNRVFVEVGGLVSYGVNYNTQVRRGATFVDKILKGAKPADLPVKQPARLELILNLKAAAALGIAIPPSMLARADKVIE